MTAASSTASVDEEFDAILPHLTLLRDLGAKVVVYADTSRGRHDGIFRADLAAPELARRRVARLWQADHRAR